MLKAIKRDWRWMASLAGIGVLTLGFLWLAKRPSTDIVAIPAFDRVLPCEITLTPTNLEQP
jgi:hypothetical protein